MHSVGGRYEVVAELARGGMAVLYLVRARGPAGFEKVAVMKRISPKWADDEEFVEMFLNEARLAASLEHPHAVAVYDLGEDAEGPYFVMEYVHGVDLHALQGAAGALPLRHVITIGIAIAGGLQHAHERGIVHRDVSPRNVLVSYDGGVKVADFGIAKAISTRTQTRPSVRKGKIGYMSPEQCRSETLTAASDVYAMGVVLHQLLTGQRLFTGDNEFAIMNAIVNRDVDPPSATRGDVPDVLDQVVLGALARRPTDRTASARAVQAALEDAASELGLTPSAAALGEFVVEVCGRRPHPWEETGPLLAPQKKKSSAQDSIETRINAPDSQALPEKRPFPWLPTVAAATVTIAGAAWLLGGAGDEVPTAGHNAPAQTQPKPIADVEVNAPPPPAEPPVAAEPAPTAPPVEEKAVELDEPETEPPSKPRKKRKKKGKKAAEEGKAFDPDGIGPLRTILD